MAEGLKQDFCEIDGNLYENKKSPIFIYYVFLKSSSISRKNICPTYIFTIYFPA